MTGLSGRIRVAVLARREIAEAANVEHEVRTRSDDYFEADLSVFYAANGPDVVLRQCDADLELLEFLGQFGDDPELSDFAWMKAGVLPNLVTRYGVSDA